ncbi:MAG: Lecithin retinol acyltransferase [Mucilaginibacter sp.]|nr:Lecithin retinol acyltransferase [Mucilaginibacter sp.]
MYYANLYNLRPGDRIVCQHSTIPFIEHHLIYLGPDFLNNELMAENHKGTNVQLIFAQDFFKNSPVILEIQPFKGSRYDRILAVQKALDLVGKPYDVINYNCESFANDIQHNHTQSDQVKKVLGWAALALIVGLIINAD